MMMRNQEEIESLYRRLEEVIDLTHADDQLIDSASWSYVCTVADTLDWVLAGISTEDFMSDSYLNLEGLLLKIRNRAGAEGQ
jgi:hypothetical protein